MASSVFVTIFSVAYIFYFTATWIICVSWRFHRHVLVLYEVIIIIIIIIIIVIIIILIATIIIVMKVSACLHWLSVVLLGQNNR